MEKPNRLLRIKRLEVGTNKCLSPLDSFVTEEQLEAMNKAAEEDKTGYHYLIVGYAPEGTKTIIRKVPNDGKA